jgi:hypothetical protein
MKVLSIDVGIKNLAFCLFEINGSDNIINIIKWDSINISEQQFFHCVHIDKYIPCNKPAKYMNDDKYYCIRHAKKQELQIPTIEQKPNFINKQSLQTLCTIAEKHMILCNNTNVNNKLKKKELIEAINAYFSKYYFKQIETINASDINLFDIGKNIKFYFDTIFFNETVIDHVIIENQIGPIANRMKTIQGMIVQYFIMSSLQVNNIEFISASNKLKCIGDTSIKTKYIERKKMGIKKCLEIITNEHALNEFISFFNTNKKKDDLSDCFLQGYWFIHNKLFLK